MMYKFTLKIPSHSNEFEEYVNIFDYLGMSKDEWDSLTEEHREAALHEAWLEWIQSFVDGDWVQLEAAK